MNRNVRAGAVLAIALVLGLCANSVFAQNVIMLIPDGMSVSGTTLARFYKGAPLALDSIASGLVSTWSSDGTIADSAPAGSAYATGWTSQTGNIATIGKSYLLPGAEVPQYEAGQPVATILEAAKLSGRSTGIISTSEFMHATPSDFAAHDVSRSNYDNLAEQIVYNNLDVVFGGGTPYLSAAGRKDKEDLQSIIQSNGYTFVDSVTSLKAASGNKLFGVFGKDKNATAMSYDIDRDPSIEPSLAEMTAKAIEILSSNPKGFFLMVEGSKIDWAAHANDPVGLVSDIIAFDDAVKVALDFAKQDGQTLVIAVTDHGNSGLSIGDRTLSSGYDKTPWTTFITPLKKAKISGEGLEAKLATRIKVDGVYEPQEAQAIRDIVAQYLGITDLSDAEVEAIGKTKIGSMNYTVGPMVGTRAKLGYTTNGHTGEDVVLYCYDPFGTRLTGLVQNTEVALYMASTLKVDLSKATAQLFQDAESMFTKKGATVTTDKSDAENPVLVVAKGDQVLRIPRNKNYAYLNGMAVNSDGVAVYNGTKWYVAKNLIDLLK